MNKKLQECISEILPEIQANLLTKHNLKPDETHFTISVVLMCLWEMNLLHQNVIFKKIAARREALSGQN